MTYSYRISYIHFVLSSVTKQNKNKKNGWELRKWVRNAPEQFDSEILHFCPFWLSSCDILFILVGSSFLHKHNETLLPAVMQQPSSTSQKMSITTVAKFRPFATIHSSYNWKGSDFVPIFFSLSSCNLISSHLPVMMRRPFGPVIMPRWTAVLYVIASQTAPIIPTVDYNSAGARLSLDQAELYLII